MFRRVKKKHHGTQYSPKAKNERMEGTPIGIGRINDDDESLENTNENIQPNLVQAAPRL